MPIHFLIIHICLRVCVCAKMCDEETRIGAQGEKSEDRGVENVTEKSEFRKCRGI